MPYTQHALSFDPRASVVLRVFEPRSDAPKASVVPHMGRFGFFRAQSEQTLWPLVPRAFA